jgi:antitoxin ParD1/3/4
MNVSLTPELDNFVHQKVESGTYHSASEVIRAGLRLLQERDEMRQAQLAQLRKEIQFGFDQIERGEYTDYKVGEFDGLMADLDALGVKRAKKIAGE